MSSKVVIQASGLGKAYRIYERPGDRVKDMLLSGERGRDFHALQDISFTVHAGEAVGIVGRNGSGKSTLLQLISGLSQPSSGAVCVNGRVAGLFELGAGFNPDFTGRENVQLGAAILGLRADELAARFDSIAGFADIGRFIDRPVREYSSGMYARLAFALCAHVRADLLVIDEILAVGDAAFQQKCARFLRAFQAEGGTLLFVSHNENAVLTLCERAIWLENGRMLCDGPSSEVCRRYATALQDDGGDFRSGGRQTAVEAVAAPAAVSYRARSDRSPFDFDPDGAGATGEATVNAVGFYADNGTRLLAAEVGEKLELRITGTAKADLENVVVAFVVRNALGRPVFSDDTALVESRSGGRYATGCTFSARFSFHLPFMQAGDCAVEAFVIAGAGASQRVVARTVDGCFLAVHSRHIGGGLANIPVLEAAIERRAAATDDAHVA